MPFASALSTLAATSAAIQEVGDAALQQLGGRPDLALVFFSPHHGELAQTIARAISQRFEPRCLIGCIAESVVGNDQEIEHRPALSLWLGSWARPVQLAGFHLNLEQTPDGPTLLGWPDTLTQADAGTSAVLALGDPFTFPVELLLRQANEDYGGLRVAGGMASGLRGPGQCRLLLGDRVLTQGAVGVLLQGAPPIRCIVSQGCRPIGKRLIITGGRDNIITELGGKTPRSVLQALWQELTQRDQQLFMQGLHIGLVTNEYKSDFRRGDFLVRNVYGLEQESGALVITDKIRVGQTVQFHVRDADTADEDLRALLEQDLKNNPHKPAAALLFTCNGRGTRLFPEPNHDAEVLRNQAGPVPLAGFFAQGELGPIAGRNFIHGFTASVVLFEE